MDIDRVIAAGKHYRALREYRAHPAGVYGPDGLFRLTERYPCCERMPITLGVWTDQELYHGRLLIHVAYAYDVPFSMLIESLDSIDAGNGVSPDALARYARGRLTGKAYRDNASFLGGSIVGSADAHTWFMQHA